MKSTPLISIIVPVYKAEKYISKCIDSILAQSFTNFEVLLINDGSPDKSGEICDEYAVKDNRIRVFHKQNGGVSSARQYGVENALGEYIIHADPDDWVEPNMLEELYSKAKEENADMVICDFYEEYRNKQIYKKQQPSALDSATILKELFQQLHGSCCNKLVKRACYNRYNIKFPLELSFCEDLYVNACLTKNNIKISYIPSAFYHYVQDINENSLVNSYSPKSYEHDMTMKALFDSLLMGQKDFSIYERRIAYLIVGRAFSAKIFSSKEFKSNFSQYAKLIYGNNNIPLHHKYAYYLSCIGLYNIVYILYIIYIYIKRFFN